MKRILAAVSFAVVTVPAFANNVGMPYEKTQFDRGVSPQTIPHDAAASGSTARTDSVWAKDYNFVAPAQ